MYFGLGIIILVGSLALTFRNVYWGFICLMIIQIVRPGEIFVEFEALRIERILSIWIILMILYTKRFQAKNIFYNNKLNLALLILLGVMFLSSFTAYWMSHSLEQCFNFIKILIVYFLGINLINSWRKLKTTIWTFIILNGWLAGSSLYIYYIKHVYMVAQGMNRIKGLTSAGDDPNTLGLTLLTAFPFLFLLYQIQKHRKYKLLILLLAGLSLWVIILTGSRSTFIGFFLVVSGVWFFSTKKLQIIGFVIVIAVVSWAFVPMEFKNRYGSITNSKVDESTQGRFDAWKVGLEIFLDRPLLGAGVGNFGIAHALGYSPENKPNYLEAHSLYFQLLGELGLLGAFAFIYLHVEMFRQNAEIRRRCIKFSKNNSFGLWNLQIGRAVFLTLLLLFMAGFFGHNLYRITWYFLAMITAVQYRITTNREIDPSDEKEIIHSVMTGETEHTAEAIV